MRKRVALLAWALVLVLSFAALAEERADRYDLIFDASQDAGRLTARFLQLVTRSDDKSGDCTDVYKRQPWMWAMQWFPVTTP